MSSSAPALVCFAVKEEAAAFRRLLGTRAGFRVVVTGMGRRNAESAVSAVLAEQRPRYVITAGFAGGLSPDLARYTVGFAIAPELDLATALLKAGARPIRFHCAERVAATAEEKCALRADSGAEAVEMESDSIQRLCQKHGIPSATIRIILDTAEEDLVLDFNQLMTPDQRIDVRKLTLAVLRAPWKIPALLRFQRQSAQASRVLAATLAQVLAI